jgi:predicted Zn-dependent peptidase
MIVGRVAVAGGKANVMNALLFAVGIAAILPMLFCCRVAAAEAVPDSEPGIWRGTLPNGLEVVIVPRTHTATVAVDVYVRFGSSMETEENSGLASLLARMLLRGTNSRTSDDIAREIAATGGSIGASAHYLSSSVMAYAPAEAFELVLDIVADVTVDPLLDGVDLEKERRIVLHDLAAREDFPEYVFHKEIGARLFPGHPFGRPNDGSVESVSRLTIERLREAHERYFVPNNMLLVIVGNVSLEAARSLIETRFGKLTSKDVSAAVHPPMPRLDGNLRGTMRKRVAQAQLFLGVRMNGIDLRGEYVLSVLNTILSHGMNSRLFTQIRETRGYVYDVHVDDTAYPDILVWGVEAGTQEKHLDEVEHLMRAELDRLTHDLVSEHELDVAKKFIEATIRRSAEANDGAAGYVGATIIRGRPLLGVEERVQLVHSVTGEEVRELAKRLLGAREFHVFTMR